MFVKIDNTFFSTTRKEIVLRDEIPYKVLNTNKIIEIIIKIITIGIIIFFIIPPYNYFIINKNR